MDGNAGDGRLEIFRKFKNAINSRKSLVSSIAVELITKFYGEIERFIALHVGLISFLVTAKGANLLLHVYNYSPMPQTSLWARSGWQT